MSSASDIETRPAVETPGGQGDLDAKFPVNWREALLTLIASRVSLIELESKEAAKDAARRVVFIVAAVGCVFFMWGLMLAGGIAALAAALGWPWYWIAMGAGAIHIVAAIGLAQAAMAKTGSAFPITRSEFQKDRTWIENLQKPRKSSV